MQNNIPIWDIGARNKPSPMNKEAMYQNLLDFKEAMDKAEIPFIWIFGGLLGLIRDNDLISWDNDIDFACFAPDHKKIKQVVDELKLKGFYVPDKNECPLSDHFFTRNQEKLEIWWFQKIGNEWIYDNKIRYMAEYFDDSQTKSFLNFEWKIPKNPERFLEITYGKTWRIPNTKQGYIL